MHRILIVTLGHGGDFARSRGFHKLRNPALSKISLTIYLNLKILSTGIDAKYIKSSGAPYSVIFTQKDIKIFYLYLICCFFYNPMFFGLVLRWKMEKDKFISISTSILNNVNKQFFLSLQLCKLFYIPVITTTSFLSLIGGNYSFKEVQDSSIFRLFLYLMTLFDKLSYTEYPNVDISQIYL